MIFADKLIALRKQQGWSQEELADRMGVSRQAVSKWESAQALPDVDKIVALAELFSVSTDYLLKDTSEDVERGEGHTASRVVTLAESEEYVESRRRASLTIALGTFLCIISVIPLLISSITSVQLALGLDEPTAVLISIISLLVAVAAGVAVLVATGLRGEAYAYLDEPFVIGHGVKEMLAERAAAQRRCYVAYNLIGVVICILSPLLVIFPALTGADEALGFTLPATVLAVGVAVCLFIVSGVRRAALMRLEGKGEYSREGKRSSRIKEAVDSIYWSLALAVYLGWSFISGDWHITWVVWPVAGVLSVGVSAICSIIADKSKRK